MLNKHHVRHFMCFLVCVCLLLFQKLMCSILHNFDFSKLWTFTISKFKLLKCSKLYIFGISNFQKFNNNNYFVVFVIMYVLQNFKFSIIHNFKNVINKISNVYVFKCFMFCLESYFINYVFVNYITSTYTARRPFWSTQKA